MKSNEAIKQECFAKYISKFAGVNTFGMPKGNRAIIITGNGSEKGLGRFLSKEFRRNGIRVFGIDRRYEYNKHKDDWEGDIEKTGLFFFDNVETACRNDKIKLYGLINNASSTYMEWFEKIGVNKFREIINDNVIASYITAQMFIEKTMDKKYRKFIINIGSMAYNSVLNASTAYCCSKSAVMMMTRCMAWELSRKNYICIQINPSSISDTGMEDKDIQGLMRTQGLKEEQAKAYRKAGTVLNRQLTKKDISHICEEIMNGKMDYLSGTAIDLRGGMR